MARRIHEGRKAERERTIKKEEETNAPVFSFRGFRITGLFQMPHVTPFLVFLAVLREAQQSLLLSRKPENYGK
jgi:formate dehydrogenase maturation protein FdhE